MGSYKRYCKILNLKDDSELIREYKIRHAPGAVWPEIINGLKQVGVVDMEIYLHGTQLFMVMDTVPDFDHESAMNKLGNLPRQSEWEAAMSKYQVSDPNESAAQKWTLMERVFELGQHGHRAPELGQTKE